MIITINRSPDWALSTLPVGAVINLPASLADPLILAGQAVPTPGAAITHTDPFGPGGSSGGTGTGHIQTVYTTLAAAAAANTGVGIGTTVYIGTAPLNYIKYEVIAQPSSVVGNWQAMQGSYSNSVTTLQLTAGKPHTLYLSVPAASTSDQVTVTVGGVALSVFLASAQTHAIPIGDPPGAAGPTTVTIQRTAGAGTVGTYSLDSGPAYSVFMGDVPTYDALIAAYPSNGAALLALPAGTRIYVEDHLTEMVRSNSGKYWVATKSYTSPRANGTVARWYGPANSTAFSNSAGHARGICRPVHYRMPGNRPAIVAGISIFQNAVGSVGAGTDAGDLVVWECYPDGRPIENKAPLFVESFTALQWANAAYTGKWMPEHTFAAPREWPANVRAAFIHDWGSSANVSAVGSTNNLVEGAPMEIVPGTTASLAPPRQMAYTWTRAYSAGDMSVWPIGTELLTGANAAIAFAYRVTD